jgi:hypothetical protein
MNICEFKSSLIVGIMLKKLNIKEVIKVLLNILNIHENWRKYVKAYFERLSYMNKDFNFNHHSFYLDLY